MKNSHTFDSGLTKTPQSTMNTASVTEFTQETFSATAWFEWVCARCAAIRNLQRNANQERIIIQELLKHDYSYADAITAEKHLLCGAWTAAKYQIGIEVSDFYQETFLISNAELQAQNRKAYLHGFNAAKNAVKNNGAKNTLSDEDKPLLESIVRLETELLREKRKNGDLKQANDLFLLAFQDRDIPVPEKVRLLLNRIYSK